MNIRPATIEDFDALVNLNKAIFINNPKFDSDLDAEFMDTPQGMKYIEESITDELGLCIVMEENGKLIGYACGTKKEIPWRKSRYFELSNLGVIPEVKGRGLGRILLEYFETEVKRLGYQKIYLECYAMNSEALNFYRKNGYSDIDISLEKVL